MSTNGGGGLALDDVKAVDRTIARLARRHNGAISHEQMLTAGIGAGAIKVRVRRGQLQPRRSRRCSAPRAAGRSSSTPEPVRSKAVDPEPGEEVFFHGHPSWRSMLAFYIKGLLVAIGVGAVAGVVSAITQNKVKPVWVIIAVLAVFVIVLIAGFIRRIQTTYTISNRRLTIHAGLLSREMHETRLERVQNVNARQSLLERILRVGTVDFDTAAGAEFDFSFRGVSAPREIVRTVDRALHELQQPHPGV